MYSNSKALVEAWKPVLNAKSAPSIKDNHRRAVTAQMLENTQRALREERAQSGFLTEDAPTNNMGNGKIGTFDPVLIALVRRAMPNLIAYDLCSVQPMTGPTGLVFAMRANYTNQDGQEALHQKINTAFSANNAQSTKDSHTDHGGSDMQDSSATVPYTGMDTATGEALGDSPTNSIAEMAFTIDKLSVTAKTRALKAEYTMELAQDLKAVHGLDAEVELANILTQEILAEINHEIVRTINWSAKPGAQNGTATAGTFDLNVDADGRWHAEKFKGLLFQLSREANAIAKDTRRGRGNFVLTSSDVAAALASTGMLTYAPALAPNANLEIDDTGATYVGMLAGGLKVYIDPYATTDYATVGYRGTNAYDAGMFYCPYVPLTMSRAVGENTFQPKIGFRTRYGIVTNPFNTNAAQNDGLGEKGKNNYFRIFKVSNMMTGTTA